LLPEEKLWFRIVRFRVIKSNYQKEEGRGFVSEAYFSPWIDILMLLLYCRCSTGLILEALHVDPASGASLDNDKSTKVVKPSARYFLEPG